MPLERKKHWETVYRTKELCDVSWTQKTPKTSLQLIKELNLPKDASIIDVGGGDSMLVDFLLNEGYTNITILDISETALEKAKKRLGNKATLVNWLVSDITDFKPNTSFDIWHDRATFHFLTTENEIKKYTDLVAKNVKQNLIVGTFSENGPEKCSGLFIKQYSEESLLLQFEPHFKKLNCMLEEHTTPFKTIQKFIFCSFKKHLLKKQT